VPGEERLGATQRGIKLREPVGYRLLRGEYERHIGARPKRKRLAWANEAVHGAPLRFRMILIG
jgi:hypothetical protein